MRGNLCRDLLPRMMIEVTAELIKGAEVRASEAGQAQLGIVSTVATIQVAVVLTDNW